MRRRRPAPRFQPAPPFGGRAVPAVTRSEFAATGFTAAHLAGARLVGWSVLSTLVVEVRRLLVEGETVRLRVLRRTRQGRPRARAGGALRARSCGPSTAWWAISSKLCPIGAALVVTSDHGQVEVGTSARLPGPELLEVVELLSGEGRFRWLHARPGAAADVVAAAEESHGARGVGPDARADRRRGLVRRAAHVPRWPAGSGDVALVARAPVAFLDPADTGETRLLAPARIAHLGRDVRSSGGVDEHLRRRLGAARTVWEDRGRGR